MLFSDNLVEWLESSAIYWWISLEELMSNLNASAFLPNFLWTIRKFSILISEIFVFQLGISTVTIKPELLTPIWVANVMCINESCRRIANWSTCKQVTDVNGNRYFIQVFHCHIPSFDYNVHLFSSDVWLSAEKHNSNVGTSKCCQQKQFGCPNSK